VTVLLLLFGRQLVAQALDRGHAITAFVRNPAKLQIDHPRFLGTPRISRADVVDFMLNQLASDACVRSAPGVSWSWGAA
jgi:putative NADH-flavin reductase